MGILNNLKSGNRVQESLIFALEMKPKKNRTNLVDTCYDELPDTKLLTIKLEEKDGKPVWKDLPEFLAD